MPVFAVVAVVVAVGFVTAGVGTTAGFLTTEWLGIEEWTTLLDVVVEAAAGFVVAAAGALATGALVVTLDFPDVAYVLAVASAGILAAIIALFYASFLAAFGTSFPRFVTPLTARLASASYSVLLSPPFKSKNFLNHWANSRLS